MRVVLGFDSWTLGDIDSLEEAAGMSLGKIGAMLASGDVSARLAIAIVYAARRREDPTYTLEAARSLKVSELEIVGGDAAPLDPPSPAI